MEETWQPRNLHRNVGKKDSKMGSVQTVKTGAALVPESPLVSLVPMMAGSYIGGSTETPFSRLDRREHHWV